jgi:hypothetical protein
MPDEWDEEPDDAPENDTATDSGGIRALRRQHQELTEQRQAARDEAAQLRAELHTLRMENALRARGIDPRFAEVLHAGATDADLDRVAEMLGARQQEPERRFTPTPEQSAAFRDSQSRMAQLETNSINMTGEAGEKARVNAAFENAAAAPWSHPNQAREVMRSLGASGPWDTVEGAP